MAVIGAQAGSWFTLGFRLRGVIRARNHQNQALLTLASQGLELDFFRVRFASPV